MDGLKQFIEAITNESLPDARHSLTKELFSRIDTRLTEQKEAVAESLLVVEQPVTVKE